MDAQTEREVTGGAGFVGVAGEVELIGSIEGPRVPVGGPDEEHDALTRRKGLSAEHEPAAGYPGGHVHR